MPPRVTKKAGPGNKRALCGRAAAAVVEKAVEEVEVKVEEENPPIAVEEKKSEPEEEVNADEKVAEDEGDASKMSGRGRTMVPAKRYKSGQSSDQTSSHSIHERTLACLSPEDRPYYEKLCGMNMLQEKGVPPALVDHVPGLYYIFNRESWANLFAYNGDVDIEVVREFYARGHHEDGQIRARVRGKMVMITPETISQTLGVLEPPRHSFEYTDDHRALLGQSEGQWKRIVGERLLPPGSPLPNSTQSTSLLPTDAKILYHIMSHTLMPTRDPRKIVALRLALVYTIMNNGTLNVGQFLFTELDTVVRERKLRILPYPMLITMICQNSGVRVAPTHMATKFKLPDLTRVIGVDHQPVHNEEHREENPKEGGHGDAPPVGFVDFMTEARVEWAEQRAFRAEIRLRLTSLEEQFQSWHGFHQSPPQGD